MTTSASNTVKFTLDPDNLPALTVQECAQLEAIAAMPDEAIDYSDAPCLPDAVWRRAARRPEKKQSITQRMDADVQAHRQALPDAQ